MEIVVLAMLIAIGAYLLKSRNERRRIALLGSHLGKYQIEELMGHLTEGYLRALGEEDSQRRDSIWSLLNTTEAKLCSQFNSFAAEFSKVAEAQARVSKFAFPIPFAERFFPKATFDLRRCLMLHAQGITSAAQDSPDRTARDKAFTLSAELFLMQHTCHWFCRYKAVASARMLVRHKTPYALVLKSVAPETRRAYGDLTGN